MSIFGKLSCWLRQPPCALHQPNRGHLPLPPLDPFSTKFISVCDASLATDQRQADRIKKELPLLKVRISGIHKKIHHFMKSKPQSHARQTAPKSFEILTGELFIEFYNKTQQKLFEIQLDKYRKAKNLCQEMICFCQSAIENAAALEINIRGFLTALNEFTTTSTQNELRHRAQLDRFRVRLPHIPTIQITTTRKLKALLQRTVASFNATLGFMPYGEFDWEFHPYLRAHHSQEFQQILDDIRGFEYIVALRQLRINVENWGKSEFGIKDFESPAFVILYGASERYLFDLVTIELPCLLRNDMSVGRFIHHCEVIRNRTPDELRADEVIFLPDQRSQKVVDLFANSPELRKGVEYFGFLQFYSSPLDVAYYGFKAITVFNQYIAATIYRNEKCGSDPNAWVPPEVIASSAAVVAFDHLFTYLYLAMAVDPPPNALAIGEYLKAFGAFEQSSKLEYSATSIQAAVLYIRNFKDE